MYSNSLTSQIMNWKYNGVKWLAQLADCWAVTDMLGRSSWLPHCGDSRAPAYSLDQGGHANVLCSFWIPEFPNLVNRCALAVMLCKGKTWVLSLPSHYVAFRCPSWIPFRIAGSILSLEALIPTPYCSPALWPPDNIIPLLRQFVTWEKVCCWGNNLHAVYTWCSTRLNLS